MLEISGLTKTYATRGGPSVGLAETSLVVATGECVALVGPSGCGKSTLLRLVAGLETPGAGRIRHNSGGDAIGVVFQEPRLMPWLDVTSNIRFGLLDLARDEQDRRIAEALRLVHLEHAAHQLPRELSGGMSQRVAIARAIARRPALLLLDEPFSALDAFTKAALQDEILRIRAETGVGLIVVTHDVEEAVLIADRVAVMAGRPGRIVETIPVAISRPRERAGHDVQDLRGRILEALGNSLHETRAA